MAARPGNVLPIGKALMKRLLWAIIAICLCGALGVALGAGQGSSAQASQRLRPSFIVPGTCETYASVITSDGGSTVFTAIPWPFGYNPTGIIDGVAYDQPIFAQHNFNTYTVQLMSGGGGSVIFRYRNGGAGTQTDINITSTQTTIGSATTLVWVHDTVSFTIKVCASPIPTNTPTGTNTPTSTATATSTPTATTIPTVTPTATVPPFNCYVAIALANDEWVAADNGIADTTGYIFYTMVDTTLLTLWDGAATLGYMGLAPFSVDVSGVSVQNSGDNDASFVYCSPAPLTVEQLSYFTLQWQVFIGLLVAVMIALIYTKAGR